MSEQEYLRVRDVMVPKVYTIGRMATVREAVDLMREKEVSSIVVERRDESDEFGLLVVSDVAKKVVARELSPDRVNVYEIMTKPVLTLAGDMNIKYAVRLLDKFDLSRALVVGPNREPMGIVTLRDMVIKLSV